jgi:hypothetical protein
LTRSGGTAAKDSTARCKRRLEDVISKRSAGHTLLGGGSRGAVHPVFLCIPALSSREGARGDLVVWTRFSWVSPKSTNHCRSDLASELSHPGVQHTSASRPATCLQV